MKHEHKETQIHTSTVLLTVHVHACMTGVNQNMLWKLLNKCYISDKISVFCQ